MTRPATLAIVGSAESAWTPDGELTARHLIQVTMELLEPVLVISGQSPKGGVDLWAEVMAEEFGVPFKGFPPTPAGGGYYTWEESYKPRNQAIAQACTHLLAIRSHRSRTYGSGWTAERARALGKIVSVALI